jgi:hypothetical protein
MSNGVMPKNARRVRFDVTVSADTLEATDDYRFATRAPDRLEAVRRLLRAGLTQLEYPHPRQPVVNSTTMAFFGQNN